MHIFHNSRIYISFSACYRWCAYFSGSNELLHHICKLFFFCPRAKHQQDRSLSVYWNVCHYEGKCISKLFDWIAIQPTTCDCQNLSLNLLFPLTFIYNAFAASDIDKKKLSHWNGSTAERERESEWEMTEWFKLPIFVHLTNKIYFREIKFTKKRETNITCTVYPFTDETNRHWFFLFVCILDPFIYMDYQRGQTLIFREAIIH